MLCQQRTGAQDGYGTEVHSCDQKVLRGESSCQAWRCCHTLLGHIQGWACDWLVRNQDRAERTREVCCVAGVAAVGKCANPVNCGASAGTSCAWKAQALQIKYLNGSTQQQRRDSTCACGPQEGFMPIPLVEACQHEIRLYTGKTIHSADSESWSLLLAVWCVTCASVLTHWVLVWNRPMLARSTTGGLDSRLQLGPGGAGALPHAICGVQLQATHIEVDGTEGRRHTASYRPRPPRCQHDSPTRCRADARTARSRRGWGGPGWGGPS